MDKSQLRRNRSFEKLIDYTKFTFKAVPVPWELIDNYSKESTIHGIKYLGEKKQHWLER